MRVCKYCLTEFEEKNDQQLYCSLQCSKNAQRARKRGRSPVNPFIKMTCPYCGKTVSVRTLIKGGKEPKTCGEKRCVKDHRLIVRYNARTSFNKSGRASELRKAWRKTAKQKKWDNPDFLMCKWKQQSHAESVHIISQLKPSNIITSCHVCGKEMPIGNKRMYCSMRCQWRSLNVKKGKSIRGRISRNVSTRFSAYLRGDGRPYVSKFSIKCLGYTFDTLKQHLESQFRPGMSWDNYGSEWHIDHIVPLSLHEHEDAMTLIKHAWSLNNLMPRWSTTGIALTHGDTQIGNMNKGNKICA